MKRVLSVVTVVICSSLWANAQSVTIADMARREREKRQAAPKQATPKLPPITNSRLQPKPPTRRVIETGDAKPDTSTTAAGAPDRVAGPVSTPIAAAKSAAASTTPTTPTPPATVAANAPSAPPPSAPVATAAAISAPPSAPAPEAPKEPVRDEKWWRERFDKARTDVRRAENQVAVAELEYNAANREFLTTSYDPDGRGPAAVNASKKKMDDAQKRLDEARGKLVQLDDELRRAGAPAGWAR